MARARNAFKRAVMYYVHVLVPFCLKQQDYKNQWKSAIGQKGDIRLLQIPKVLQSIAYSVARDDKPKLYFQSAATKRALKPINDKTLKPRKHNGVVPVERRNEYM